MELEVGTNETFFIKKENGKYDQHFSPLTPPMSPKDIVDKARFYVEKVSVIRVKFIEIIKYDLKNRKKIVEIKEDAQLKRVMRILISRLKIYRKFRTRKKLE